MMASLRKLTTRHEFIIFLTIVVLSIVVGAINPAYFSSANIARMLNSAIVIGIFSLGVLIVLISGGIDVSFTAIAIFSMYVTVNLLLQWGYEGPVGLAFLISGGIGLILGLINAFFIALFRLPTLIVTLGTLSLYRGFMLFFIGSTYIRDIPQGMDDFSRSNLMAFEAPNGGQVQLRTAVLILIGLTILVSFILRYTMLGRGIYAMGGAREAAERAGFNIRQTQFFIYGFAGFIAGIAGLTFGSLLRQANPFSIVGMELDVIAAVVLGGASIAGGRGTVIGTLLGVLLITIVSNSLVLVGIPSDWQSVAVGIILIIGTAIPAVQAQRAARRARVAITQA
jgi:simple sugar transport system permease protein